MIYSCNVCKTTVLGIYIYNNRWNRKKVKKTVSMKEEVIRIGNVFFIFVAFWICEKKNKQKLRSHFKETQKQNNSFLFNNTCYEKCTRNKIKCYILKGKNNETNNPVHPLPSSMSGTRLLKVLVYVNRVYCFRVNSRTLY